VSSANHSGSDPDLTASSHFGNKDTPPDTPLQPAVDCEDGQREDSDSEEEESVLYDDLEILEQSSLDHFNAILQNAQKIAAKAEREKKPPKRPKTYDGRSKKTQQRHKKQREDLAKQGYLSVFDFIARTKARESLGRQASEGSALDEHASALSEGTASGEHTSALSDSEECTLGEPTLAPLKGSALGERVSVLLEEHTLGEQVSALLGECALEEEASESDTECLMSKRVGQVRHKELSIHKD
jgi:hypothetical protein